MSLRYYEQVDRFSPEPTNGILNADRRAQRQEIVQSALSRIGPTEKYVILRLYFVRESPPQVGRRLRLSAENVDYIRRRALTRLRCLLANYVTQEFGVTSPAPDCPLCESEGRDSINKYLLKCVAPVSLEVVRELRVRFDLRLRSLRLLSEHVNYHLSLENIR